MPSSRAPGFYNWPLEDRLKWVVDWANLTEEEAAVLRGEAGLPLEQADRMIENVVGRHALPLGIALNFQVNGRDVLVPMAIEEPSVVAGASFAAKLARAGGGFRAEATPPEMIGQIQVLDLPDLEAARAAIEAARERILARADEVDPVIRRLGGGARDLEVRPLPETPAGPMLVIHLIYDCRDAMGANAVNTACEALAPLIEEITGGRVGLRILSNLAERRLARAECTIPADALAFDDFPGERVAQGIVEAWAFAAADPYRAATHNKGILNGVDAVAIATGQDWRAIEAGAHAYAARSGRYTSLSTWSRDEEGNLVGRLEMPMAVGTVGGATRSHPTARVALKILGVQTARELAEVMVAVGLAQNLAALRALATEGIQKGHMALHARQVAIAAGARGEEIEQVARQMVAEGVVRLDRAEEILRERRSKEAGEQSRREAGKRGSKGDE
ncbi:MAG TPA: hydroxymethylglutaryl-CoA reductase, degradative [Thermoflexia bacterium]|nr:hydroxymethylglutaryl-CoA reductase, degradative [Thermoflexia bacterium]